MSSGIRLGEVDPSIEPGGKVFLVVGVVGVDVV